MTRLSKLSLDDPIERLPGAGKVTAARLMACGLASVRDMVYFFPRAYQDFRGCYAIGELAGLAPGTPVVVRGQVVRIHKFFRRLLDVMVEQDGAVLRARWFHPNAGMSKTYVKGSRVALAGVLHRTPAGQHELVHPSNVTAMVGEAGGLGIRPRYPLVQGVPARTVEKLVAAALDAVGDRGADPLPSALCTRLGFPELGQALRDIHRPPSTLSAEAFAALAAGASPAHRRAAFEELFVLQVGLARERTALRDGRAWDCSAGRDGLLASVRSSLPFACTTAQEHAIESIASSLQGGSPMQCLLQGEVGSGKTAVVFAAALLVARAGGQTLLMAPTAVLAEQHAQTLAAWGAHVGLRTLLLHAGLPSAEQVRVIDAAASGQVDLIVGTHSLLEERLRLRRLVLAVVDEQHRFGVRQRARLRRVGGSGVAMAESGFARRSGNAGRNGNPPRVSISNDWQIGSQNGMVPHLLVLSATPIPRTLALTVYGDLDLVTLDSVPSGRKPVVTSVCTEDEERKKAYQAIKNAAVAGGRAFVVCPAIAEASGDGPRPISVLALAKELRRELAPARVGVLHGRLTDDQQRSIVRAFREGALDVLVSTTVLEVGVDVPSARVMVIEDAERFGLSQLHQLRGRVGRGNEQGLCFVVTRSKEPEALQRLQLLAAVHDGFRIAEMDLRQRGPGDLQGTRQTGAPELRFADLSVYANLLELARNEALQLLANTPDLSEPEHEELRCRVALRLQKGLPIAEEAG